MRHRGTALWGMTLAGSLVMSAPAMAAPGQLGGDRPKSGTAAAAGYKAAKAADRAAAKTTAASTASATALAASTKPAVVSLTFDDQRVSQNVTRTALSQRGFKGTYYVISQFINNAAGDHPESLTMTQLKNLAVDGNEIAGHTKTHADLPTLTAARQKTEICGGRQDLINDRFKAPVSFAYPYGDYDATTESIVGTCGFTSARTVSDGPDSIPPYDRYATAAIDSVDNTTTVAALKAAVKGAETDPTQKWVQLVWHDIVTSGSQAEDEYYQLTPSFNSFLTWLKSEVTAGRVVVKTVGQVLSGQ